MKFSWPVLIPEYIRVRNYGEECNGLYFFHGPVHTHSHTPQHRTNRTDAPCPGYVIISAAACTTQYNAEFMTFPIYIIFWYSIVFMSIYIYKYCKYCHPILSRPRRRRCSCSGTRRWPLKGWEVYPFELLKSDLKRILGYNRFD